MGLFEIIVGILFVLMGGMKLKGAMQNNKGLKKQLKMLKVPFKAIYFISIVEVIAGLGLVFGRYVAEAQWVLFVWMVGAVLTHWKVKDFKGSTMALFLLVLVSLLIFL